MNFITNLKSNFQRYLLSKNSQKNTNLKAINFKKASKIAIVYNASKNTDIKVGALANLIISSQKELYMLGFIKKSKDNYMPPTRKGSLVFTNKDLNFLNIPKSEQISNFLEKDYDILLYLSDNKCYPISYISSKCKASLKIGFYSPLHTALFDFMIDSGNTYDIDNFTQQIKQFIHIIEKK